VTRVTFYHLTFTQQYRPTHKYISTTL